MNENLRYFENRTPALQTQDADTPQVWYVEDEDLTLFTTYTEDNMEVIPVTDSEGNIELKVVTDCLKFTSTGDSEMRIVGSGKDIKYSYDRITWNKLVYGIYHPIRLSDGEFIYLKGSNKTLYGLQFMMSGSIAASGNIMSLIDDGLCGTGTMGSRCFEQLFKDCSALTSAPYLPATTLSDYCYSEMFSGCTSLTSLTCKATDISANYALSLWLSGISTNGILYVDPSMTGAAWNIPSTWTIQAIS